jgi:hypothetical protein
MKVVWRDSTVLLVLGLLAGGCGRGGGGESGPSRQDQETVNELLSDTVGTSTVSRPRVELPANVVFTRDDIPREGGYLQITLGDLTDDQANRFMRRVKSEYCTCSCPHTIDQCLIEDPACTTAHQLATQILNEESGPS